MQATFTKIQSEILPGYQVLDLRGEVTRASCYDFAQRIADAMLEECSDNGVKILELTGVDNNDMFRVYPQHRYTPECWGRHFVVARTSDTGDILISDPLVGLDVPAIEYIKQLFPNQKIKIYSEREPKVRGKARVVNQEIGK